jgi:hypothetical protein
VPQDAANVHRFMILTLLKTTPRQVEGGASPSPILHPLSRPSANGECGLRNRRRQCPVIHVFALPVDGAAGAVQRPERAAA